MNYTIGRLMYKEVNDPAGQLQSSSLIFIDSEPEKTFPYTQIFLAEDFGSGFEAYTEIEAGMYPEKHLALYREATDDDLRKVVDLVRRDPDSAKITKWFSDIEADEILLSEEKKRLLSF